MYFPWRVEKPAQCCSPSLSLPFSCVLHTGIACFSLRGPFLLVTHESLPFSRFPSPSPSSLHLSVKKGRKQKREESCPWEAMREREGERRKEGGRRDKDWGEWTDINVKYESEKSKEGEETVREETRDGWDGSGQNRGKWSHRTTWRLAGIYLFTLYYVFAFSIHSTLHSVVALILHDFYFSLWIITSGYLFCLFYSVCFITICLFPIHFWTFKYLLFIFPSSDFLLHPLVFLCKRNVFIQHAVILAVYCCFIFQWFAVHKNLWLQMAKWGPDRSGVWKV